LNTINYLEVPRLIHDISCILLMVTQP